MKNGLSFLENRNYKIKVVFGKFKKINKFEKNQIKSKKKQKQERKDIMQAAPQTSASKVHTGPVSSQKNQEGSFNKSEKTKDIRSTNITAAKGFSQFLHKTRKKI